MGGFFVTFMLLVIAMAWAQWLTLRVSWVPRVVYVSFGCWLLALVFAFVSLRGAVMEVALVRAHMAATTAMGISVATLVAMIPLSIYAYTQPPLDPEAS